MSSDGWEEKKLDDILTFYNGKKRPQNNGIIPVFGGNGILDYCCEYNTEDENLIIGRVGAYCGNVNYLKGRCWISDNAILAKTKEKNVCKFVYYLLCNENLHEMQIGSSQPLLTQGILKNISISVPSFGMQRAIAATLSALDDKIELNNRINKTLEEMAQALFKRWFVDFEFPDEKGLPYKSAGGEMEESELGLIPKGWKVGKIGDIAEVIDCLHSKKPERLNVGKPLLQLNNILENGLLDMTDTFNILPEDYRKWISRMEAISGDCVITNVGRVGAVAQIPFGFRAALGRNMTGIRLKPKYQYPSFLITMLLADSMKTEIKRLTDIGTILNALNVKSIPLLRFPLAPTLFINKVESLIKPMREKMEQNLSEKRRLVSLRDALLPKLMSGEIRVPIEEVTAHV